MTRGPAPQPTALKILRGNPGRRPINQREPQPKLAALKCPRWMPTEGRREWLRVVRELTAIGLLSIVDQGSLEIMCNAYASWRKHVEWIAQHGDIMAIKDENGKAKYLQQMPQVSMANKAAEVYRKLASEFGLTPAARTRIQTPQREVDEEKLNKFFG